MGSTQEAEEVTQDAILKAWSRLGELHDAGACWFGWWRESRGMRHWIARNNAFRQYMEESVLDGNAPPRRETETEVERADDRAALVQEIGQLPEGQAEVVNASVFSKASMCER